MDATPVTVVGDREVRVEPEAEAGQVPVLIWSP